MISTHGNRRQFIMVAIVSMLALLVLATPGAGAAPGGNAGASAACENGGYLSYTDANGKAFKNEGQCAKYAAKGGTLVRIPVSIPASITVSFIPHDSYYPACIPVAHLAHFEPNTTYTVQQYIINGPYTNYYPSFTVTTDGTGSGTGSPVAFGIFSPYTTTFHMSVGSVSSAGYAISCY